MSTLRSLEPSQIASPVWAPLTQSWSQWSPYVGRPTMHGVRKLRAYSFGHLPGAVLSGEEDQDHTLAAIVNLRVSNFGDPPIYSIAVLLNADPIFVAARMIPITHLSLSIGSNGKKLGPQVHPSRTVGLGDDSRVSRRCWAYVEPLIRW